MHALVVLSPFLKTLPLAAHGLEFVHPPAPFAHPFDDGTAVVVERSIDETAESLGGADARAYRRLIAPLRRRAPSDLMEALLGPPGLRHPLLMARFGLTAIRSAAALAHATLSRRAHARDARRRGRAQHGAARLRGDGRGTRSA